MSSLPRCRASDNRRCNHKSPIGGGDYVRYQHYAGCCHRCRRLGKWEGSMLRRIVTRAAIAIGLAAGPMIVTTAPAYAWSWSSQVTLTGTVKVIYHPGITGVYVSGSDGEKGWASLGSGNGYSRAYSFKFNNVPGGSGMPTRRMSARRTPPRSAGSGSVSWRRPRRWLSSTRHRCSASTSTARPGAAPCPSAGVRSIDCRVSARRPSRRRAAGG